jgi:hypothetical protein
MLLMDTAIQAVSQLLTRTVNLTILLPTMGHAFVHPLSIFTTLLTVSVNLIVELFQMLDQSQPTLMEPAAAGLTLTYGLSQVPLVT